MPEKLDRCVKALIEQGKAEESAYAICNAQLSDSYSGQFRDSVIYDPTEKAAISVRDGVLEYLGGEIGMEPRDRVFTVYRSPATIANAAMKMPGIPVTDDHVTLAIAPPTGGGAVVQSEMIDFKYGDPETTIAIKNKLQLSDTITAKIEAGKRELSLGYIADLVPHDVYDFEQLNIQPHHLAIVDRGRCGSMCSFIDRKPKSEESMKDKKIHKAFQDAEGQLSLQQIVELAAALPEAIKSVPVDQLQDLIPALQQIIEAAKGVMPEEPKAEETAEETPAVDEEKPEEEKKPGFSDADVKGFVDEAVKLHAQVIDKARQFVDDKYSFIGKTTDQIMRDALATENSVKFTDQELPLAFKLLKKSGSYKKFGDQAVNKFDALKDKEL